MTPAEVIAQEIAHCSECKTEGSIACDRCRQEHCAEHTPDGDLCSVCFHQWTKLSKKGGTLLGLAILPLAIVFLLVLNTFVAFGAIFGLAFLGAQIGKARIPGRRRRFIEAGRPVLPKSVVVSEP